jgi:hypothetical protein
MIIEGDENAEEETILEAWQYLIDEDIIKHLQGFYHRQAKRLIEAGVCHGN